MSITSTGSSKLGRQYAYRINDAALVSGLCRSSLYNLMRRGPLGCQLLAGVDGSEGAPKTAPAQAELLRNPRAVREAKLELTRDLLHEALGWARIYAATAQTFAEIGDDTGALFSLTQFHKAATAACQAGRLIREGRGE